METTKLILDHIDKYALVISQKVSAIAPQVIAMVKQRIIAEFTVSVVALVISIAILMSGLLVCKDSIGKNGSKYIGGEDVAIILICIGGMGIIGSIIAVFVNGLNIMSLDYSTTLRILNTIR